VVFKRRDKQPFWRWVFELLWPRGGWTRAFHYVKHRLRRLPATPERIARGIWAGVFTTFTPLYGLHFFVAAGLARLMQGNILAALMATFFGNPLTYVPIGIISLQTGHFLMGQEMGAEEQNSFGGAFVDAWRDLTHNFFAMFDDETADWTNLIAFYDDVFVPYLVGGLIPGMIAATICYYLSAPLIRAYQKRRKGLIKAKFEALKAKAAAAKKKQAEHPGG